MTLTHKLMEVRNIETLHPNPDNDRILTDKGKDLLLHAMSMGDVGSFLIIPDGLIINGNNRFYLRTEAGWDNKEVHCRILTYGQDSEGFYAIVDGQIVKQNEVIPHHYVSVEALYKAYSFIMNGEAAYDDPDAIANKWDQWQLDKKKFQVHIFEPKNYQDTLDALKKSAREKLSQVIIPFDDPDAAQTAHEEIVARYPNARLKV